MNEKDQAYLLELFMRALRKDLRARPPVDLDAGTASFVRRLIRSNAMNHERRMSAKSQDSMWQSILNQAAHSDDYKEKFNMSVSTAFVSEEQKINFRLSTWVASMVIALLIGAMVVVMASMSGRPKEDMTVALAQPTSTDATAFIDTEGEQGRIPSRFQTGTAIIHLGTEYVNMTMEPMSMESVVVPTAVPIGVSPTNIGVPEGHVTVITAYLDIPAGTHIRDDMLVRVLWPVFQRPSGSFETVDPVVNSYASVDIPRFMPILEESLVSDQSELVLPTQIPLVTMTPVPTSTATLAPTPAR